MSFVLGCLEGTMDVGMGDEVLAGQVEKQVLQLVEAVDLVQIASDMHLDGGAGIEHRYIDLRSTHREPFPMGDPPSVEPGGIDRHPDDVVLLLEERVPQELHEAGLQHQHEIRFVGSVDGSHQVAQSQVGRLHGCTMVYGVRV